MNYFWDIQINQFNNQSVILLISSTKRGCFSIVIMFWSIL